jgi:DNA polymerase-3 subunit gamma/tau
MGGSSGPQAALAGAAPALAHLPRFDDVVDLIRDKRDMTLLVQVETGLRLVRYSPGRIDFAPTPDAPADLAQRLGTKLQIWTGQRWGVSISNDAGAPTIDEQRRAARNQADEKARENSLVAAVFNLFPQARIAEIRALETDIPQTDGAPAPVVEFDPDWDPFDDD